MLINEMLVRKLNYQGEFVVEGSTKRRWLQDNYKKIFLALGRFCFWDVLGVGLLSMCFEGKCCMLLNSFWK
jgi:hypothetical protein